MPSNGTRDRSSKWNEGSIEVDTAAELRATLQRLHQQFAGGPEIVVLTTKDQEGEMMLGLGCELVCVVIHEPVAETEWTNEWWTRGATTEPGGYDYRYFGHHTEWGPNMAVPLVTALDCVEQYFETRERLASIEWEHNQL